MVNYLYQGNVYSFPKELGKGYLISDNELDLDTHYVRINIEPVIEEVVETIEDIRNLKLQEIKYYDKSPEVNSFMFRGSSTWLDRDTRVSLRDTALLIKNSDEEYMNFWIGDNMHEIKCDDMLNMLSELEIYAYNCYHTTQAHLKNVKNLIDIQEIKEYDYKIGYPEILTL